MRRLLPRSVSLLLACSPTPAGPGSTSELPTSDTTEATTTTTTDPTQPTTDDSTTHAGDFFSHFDLPRETCDVWAQDCPPGQKCVPWSDDGSAWNALKCVDIAGDGAPGEPCAAPEGPLTGLDDCALGSICWDVDPNNHGTCIGQCTGTPDAPLCPALHHCSIANGGILTLCLPWCDPLAQDCPDYGACIATDDTFLCVLTPNLLADINESCEFANACQPGLVCLPPTTTSAACDPNALGCCTPFCQLPAASCPNPDQQCVPWFDPMKPIPPGYESLGVCAIPE